MLRTYTFNTSVGFVTFMAYSLAGAYTKFARHYSDDVVVYNVDCGL